MNLETGKALVQDALYQVLDNKIFRLMVIVSLVPVSLTWLVAFEKDRVVPLFQEQWAFDYGGILRFLDISVSDDDLEMKQAFIRFCQVFFVDFIAGNIGIAIAIAATAFFLPKTLEKGAADTLFSKPVHRMTLLLARYFSGILFVSFLAIFLIGGMHVGLLVRSGYSDPGFLWGALLLVYLFAIVHAFSVLVGTITRSSVAAILSSLFLFMFSGCVHQGWTTKEYFANQEDTEELFEAARELSRKLDEELDPEAEAGAAEAPGVDPEQQESLENRLIKVGIFALNTLHYTLPKTTDADVLIRVMRKKLEKAPLYELNDEAAFLMIERPLPDFERVHERSIDLSETPATWIKESEEGHEIARIELKRFVRKPDTEEVDRNGKKRRARMLSPSGLGKRLMDELEDREAVTKAPRKTRGSVDGTASTNIAWRERSEDHESFRQTSYFGFGDWMFQLDATFDTEEVSESERERTLARHISGYQFARGEAGLMNPNQWYEKEFGFGSELRFNAWFSIGSTLLFVLVCLGIAWFRLRRIDF